jgi:hypothetical protein
MVRMSPDIDSDFGGRGWRLEKVNTLSILHSYAYCYIASAICMVRVGVGLIKLMCVDFHSETYCMQISQHTSTRVAAC